MSMLTVTIDAANRLTAAAEKKVTRSRFVKAFRNHMPGIEHMATKRLEQS